MRRRILKTVLFLVRIFFVLVVLSSPDGTQAQQNQLESKPTPQPSAPKLLFNQIPTELGLSQNVITCSLQDKDGFLWFGTKDGLNRFDGYQFKAYRQNPNDSTSISDSSITAIFEDTEGRMWVGTENGLNLFDRTYETFYRFLPDADNSNSISHQQIRAIAEDKQGAIWVSTSGGVNKLKPVQEGENPVPGIRFTHFKNDPNNPDGIDQNNINSVIVTDENTVMVKTGSGRVFTLTLDSDGKNYLTKPFRTLTGEEGDIYSTLSKGKNGNVWIGLTDGLWQWNSVTGQSKIYRYDSVLKKLGSIVVRNIFEDSKGNVWFCGYWGLVRFYPTTEKFDYFPADPKDNPGAKFSPLLEYGFNSILEDHSGAFWFGSNGKGLVRYDRGTERFSHSREQSSKISLWNGTSVRTLTELDDGNIILSSAGSFLLRVNRTTGGAIRLKMPYRGIFRDEETNAVFQDRLGALWIGGGDWLKKFDLPNTEKSTNYILDQDRIDFDYGSVVNKLFEDSSGVLWALTRYKIYRFNRETDSFSGYQFDARKDSEINNDPYVDIYEDKQGVFWIATTDGLVRFDPKSEAFKRYRNNPQDTNSLSHNAVRTVAPDPFEPNILWLGTKGGGLNRFDTNTETFSVQTEKEGLANNVIYGILSDDEGNLWMSTNNGISRFNPRNLTFKNFDKKDGLQDNEFNSCAFFKSKSGELFFGGINGFNAFYPSDVKDNPNPPPVVLTGFQILNNAVSFKEKDSPLKQTITETKEITLDYEQRFFSFEFAALDFTEPGKNQYAYQLEGFDKDLIHIGTRRTAFYTNVSPGSYLFRVIASNNDGVWNREGVTVRVTILPPFWQTWWFITLMVLAGFGLILLIVFPRISKLRYEKEIQEAFAGQLIEEQENDRKRIAAELHDGLGQSLLIIKNRAFLGEKVAEKEINSDEKLELAHEQFGEISESATEALEQVREIAYYLRPSQLERLGLTSSIEEMIERVSDSSNIEFEVEMEDLDGVFSKQNEINFYRIIQESLNNIIKHSGAKFAKIKITKSENGVNLIIKDNGKGFVMDETAEKKSKGLGLKGMSERARLLGGTYSIKSTRDVGTTVVVKILK